MKYSFLALLFACSPALAQVSFNAGVVSDNRYRGISLSDEQSAALAGVNVDFATGLYAGLSAARVRFDYTRSSAMATAYAGYARRLGQDWNVDAGVSAIRFNGLRNYDYDEVYVGAGVERLGMRISVSPHYFGVGGRTVYVELNGSRALTPEIDLVAHVGYLDPQARSDIKLGLSAAIEAWTVQLAWSATREGALLYPRAPRGHARRVVLGVTRSF